MTLGQSEQRELQLFRKLGRVRCSMEKQPQPGLFRASPDRITSYNPALANPVSLFSMTATDPQTLPLDDAFQQAVAHHQAGRLQEAEQLYNAILEVQPDHPDANFHLGVMAVQVNQPAIGLPHFKAALDADPDQDQYWLSYINALIQADQIDAAVQVQEKWQQRGSQRKAMETSTGHLEDRAQATEQTNPNQHASKEPLPVASAVSQNKKKKPKTKPTKPDKPTRKSVPHKEQEISHQMINALVALFAEGRSAEAASLAENLTIQFPLSGIAWKALGVAFKQLGRNAEALSPIQKAAALMPRDAEAQFNLGVALLDIGRADDAVASYRQALRVDPNFAEAQFNLGFTLQYLGQLDDAVASYHRALEIKPDYVQAHCNLGNVLKDLGQLDDAVASYHRALEIKPDYVEAHCNLGNALKDLGQLDGAMACYRQALEIKPDYAGAHYNLGNSLKDLGQLDGAVTSYRRALEIQPDYALAHFNLGNTLQGLGQLDNAAASYRRALEIKPNLAEAHNNLGNVLRSLKQLENAVASYRLALEIKPDYAEAHSNLGVALKDLGRLDEAVASFRQALEINPNAHGVHSNLGNALKDLGRLDEAKESLRRALEIKPDYAEALSNLGATLQDLGQFDDAAASYRRALEIDPDLAKAGVNLNLAITTLCTGRLTEGWAYYEGRFAAVPNRNFAHRYWAGEDLDGKSILIWGEQGIGDEIPFASMYSEIVALAGRCVIECSYKLLPLFVRSFPRAQVVPSTTPPHPATLMEIDYQSAAGSLGRWLRPSLESFPEQASYLIPDPERVAYWRARLATLGPGLKVGFCWRSSLMTGARLLHYTRLDQWGPIFAVPGVHFVNLQYDECSTELHEARQRFGVPLHAFEEVDLYNDLDESAALTQALDLVISAGTATASLAAALGVHTWETSYGFNWIRHGTDHYPWFPTVRLFPRLWNQSWDEIILDISGQLAEKAVAP